MNRLMCALALLAATVAAANTGDYLLHARVSYTDGGAMIRGTSDADWSYATVNTLVFQGDTFWLDREGALEVEFSGGSFLRVADGSKTEITSLPPSGAVKAWFGALYIQRTSRAAGDFLVETPAGTVSIPGDTQTRVDVANSGATTVTVRWGTARVYTPHGSPVDVREGQRVFVDPGLLPSTPVAFDRTVEDAFDGWNRERAALLATGGQIPYVTPAKTQPLGVSDLGRYGEWVYVDNRTYWRPTVVVNYTPYRYGHWSYAPAYGYTWVGDYPFCYVTSHYGRWTYQRRYGWLWVYQDTWGPAWVATVRYGPNFVWAPLDPFDRPVIIDAYFTAGGIRFSYATSSWCAADSLLYYGPTRVYPVSPTVINPIYANNVYIWNIYTTPPPARGRHTGPNYDRALEVRDYTPRRVIRGPDTVNPQRPQAAVRVQSLEASTGRSSFETAASREVRRTAANRPDQLGATRSVRLSEQALTDTRQAQPGTTRRVRAEDATTAASERMVRSGAPVVDQERSARAEASARTNGPERGRAIVPPQGETAQSDGRPVRTPDTTLDIRNMARTGRTAPEAATATEPGQTRVRTYEPDAARNYLTPDTGGRTRTAGQAPSVPSVVERERTVDTGRASATPAEAPARVRSVPDRTPVRIGPDTVSRVQTVSPSVRTAAPPAARNDGASVPDRTPVRTSPDTGSRAQTVSPSIRTAAPPVVREDAAPAPVTRVPQTVTPSAPSLSPREQRPAPQPVQGPRVSPLPDLPNPITPPARPMQPEAPVIPQRVAPATPQIVPRAPMPEAPVQPRMDPAPRSVETGPRGIMLQDTSPAPRMADPGSGPAAGERVVRGNRR